MHDGNIKDKVFSGVFWKFAERILAQLISFIVSIVLARILSPDDYGIVAMILIFISLADVFITSGFCTALIQKKDADEIDFSTNFYCSLFVSIIIYLIFFIMAPYIANFYNEKSLTALIRVFAIRLIFGAYNSIQHAYVSRHMLFRRFFFSTLFGTLLSGIVGILMAVLNFGAWALVAQYLTNTVVDIIVLNFTVPWKPQLLFSFNSAKQMMRFGWKVLLADLIGTFFNELRSLVVGKIYTSSDLAYYNKGQQLPSLITNNISNSIISVLFPAISNENGDSARIKQMLRRAIKTTSYVIFPMIFGLIVVAESLVLLLFTEKWLSCVFYIRLLALSSAIGIIGTTSLQGMKAIGRSDVLLSLEIIKKPVYLILLIIGTKISVKAIAVTMVVYSFYSNFVNAFQLKKLFGYSFFEQFKDLEPAIILSTSMAVVLLPISWVRLDNLLILFLQVFIGIIYYVFMSKKFKIETFDYLLQIINRKLSRKKRVKKC